MTIKEVASVLTGCTLMVLAASANIWHYTGVVMLRRTTYIDEYQIHILKTLLPVGILVGAIIFSISAEAVGRKITLLAIAVPYIIAFTLFQFARTIPLVSIGQVIAGLGVGGTFVVLPIYIGELAAPSLRGFLSTLMTVFFYIGMIMFRALGEYTTYTIVNVTSICLSGVFFLIFLVFGLESPFYYIKQHKGSLLEELEESKLGGRISEEEIKYIQNTKLMKCFGSTGWMKSVTIMLFLIVVYHLSGIYIVPMLIHYTYEYFVYKDYTLSYEIIQISSYAIQLLGTILCALIVDKLGRKFCLMISTLFVGIILAPLAIFSEVRLHYTDIDPQPTLIIVFVIMFLIFFNIGIQPVPQILLGELFPLQTKTVAVATIVSIQEVTVFLVKTYYPDITWFIGYTSSLFVFMASMFVATGLIYFFTLETKRKSLQEIQLALKNK